MSPEALVQHSYAPANAAGVVGPNAVLQLLDPLRELGGEALLGRVFHQAGALQYLRQPPLAMVPEEHARNLFLAVRKQLPDDSARSVLAAAGKGTAEYVIANRIPAVIGGLLKCLPARPGAPLLCKAIERHAWTFAGSGACQARAAGGEAWVEIHDNPLAAPGCPWHGAVIETLFRVLIDDRLRIRHPSCCAEGAKRCRFELRRTP